MCLIMYAPILLYFCQRQGEWRCCTKYSRLLIIRTFKGNRKQFELSGVQVIEGKIIYIVENDMKGNENWFELAGGSSYRGFELPGVDCNKMWKGRLAIVYTCSALVIVKIKMIICHRVWHRVHVRWTSTSQRRLHYVI